MRLIFSRPLALILFSLILFSTSVANVDGVDSRISGRVVDQNEAAVIGAAVTASNNATRQSVSTVTDATGEFAFVLGPGEYTLQVTAKGFNSLSRRLTVSPGGQDVIAISMEIGTTTAIVNITDGGENYQTATVYSAAKMPIANRDLPQAVSVVGKQQIKDQLFSSISDIARYQPGISSPQGENNRDQLIIRGQNSSADFFLNGVRDDVQYYRDLYNLERVEILRGPNALTFGRGGGGGVVNRIAKEAGQTRFFEFTAQGGGFGDRRGTFDVNTPLGEKVALRFNGVGETSDSFRDFVEMHRYGFSPTATITPDAFTRITVGYDLFRDRRTADRGISSLNGRPVDVPISTFFGDPENSKVGLGAGIFNASFERVIGDLIVRNRTMYGDYDRFYQNYVPGAINATTGLVALSAYNNATRRRNLFNQSDFIYNLTAWGIKHTVLGGFELGRQQSDNFRNTGFFNNTTTSVLAPYNDPVISTPITFRQSATDADNRVRVNLAAAYIQDQIELSRYVQILAGARFDYFDLDFHNNRNGADLGRIDRLVSPRFGIVVKPFTRLSLYGNYNVSYLPSSGDQFSSLTSVTQQVKPEKFTNYEFGVKWDILDQLSLTSAVYRLDRTNTRANHPTDPSIIVQTGSQRTNGFELSLDGAITRNWSVTGGYAFQDAFISSTTAAAVEGQKVAQVPHHSFTMWNRYQVLKRLGIGAGIVHRTDTFASIDNTVILPAYTRVDAAVFYTFNEHWRLQANVENVFNTRYYQNADNNTNITPGAPVSAKVALVARF